MKDENNVKDEVCSFKHLYKAAKKCKNSAMWKDSVIGWMKNSLTNIVKLRNELLNDRYQIKPYIEFTITEPKVRHITSTRFTDRVFQRSLCENYLYHQITKHFIYDNCACQIGKGTDFARKRFSVQLQRHYARYGTEGYILKCDIKDYFGSTDHCVLKNTLKKMIDDDWAYGKVEQIIDSFGDGEKGIGLGSQVSQLMQLALLDEMDHTIKEKFRIRNYIRYMDDFILISDSKDKLIEIKCWLDSYLFSKKLYLNTKKTYIAKVTQPIRFLGFSYRLAPTGRIVKKILRRSVTKEKKRIRGQLQRVRDGKMKIYDIPLCYQSWIAFAEKGDSYTLINSMKEYIIGKEKEYDLFKQAGEAGKNGRKGGRSFCRLQSCQRQ